MAKKPLRPNNVEWESALALGYGHFEVYGFHTLEALQGMTERRKGAETGVKAVQCLEGAEAWEAARAGRWDRTLLDTAVQAVFAKVPPKKASKIEEADAQPIVYLIEYNDGLKAATYMSPRHVHEFAFAGRAKGKIQPETC